MGKSSSKPGFWSETLWSSIVRARDGDCEALGRVLGRYRTPILREIQCRRCCTHEEAEEIAHRFIEVWMQRSLLKNTDPGRGGKFRTFLKTCIGNFLNDVHDKETSGGKPAPQQVESLSEPPAEDRPAIDPPAPAIDPGTEFDRRWAEAVLNNALITLQQECRDSLRGPVFEALKADLGGSGTTERLQEMAARLGLSEEAVKTYRHRMRQRLRALMQEEVRSSCGPGEDWEEEFRYLAQLLAGTGQYQ